MQRRDPTADAPPFLSLPSRLQSDRREKRYRHWLIHLKQAETSDGEEKTFPIARRNGRAERSEAAATKKRVVIDPF
jgi:hypothetical protein